MEDSIDARITRLLTQLEEPYLAEEREKRIRNQIKFLQGLQPQLQEA